MTSRTYPLGVEEAGELEGQTSIDDVLVEMGELPTAAAYDLPTLF